MKVLFSKYNRGRAKEYQIETLFVRKGNEKYVLKKALNNLAERHILTIRENYDILSKIYGEDSVAKVELINNKTVKLEFVEGKNWGDKVIEIAKKEGKDAFLFELDKYKQFLKKMETNEEMVKNYNCFDTTFNKKRNINIDLTLDNLIINNRKITIIDYEWIYFNVPVTFVLYRAICNFYYNKYNCFLKKFIKIEEIWEYYKIDINELERCKKLEQQFQKAIESICIKNLYDKGVEDWRESLSLKKAIKKRIKQIIKNNIKIFLKKVS